MTRAEFVEIIERAEKVLRDAKVPFTPFEELEWMDLMKQARAMGITPGEVREWMEVTKKNG